MKKKLKNTQNKCMYSSSKYSKISIVLISHPLDPHKIPLTSDNSLNHPSDHLYDHSSDSINQTIYPLNNISIYAHQSTTYLYFYTWLYISLFEIRSKLSYVIFCWFFIFYFFIFYFFLSLKCHLWNNCCFLNEWARRLEKSVVFLLNFIFWIFI